MACQVLTRQQLEVPGATEVVMAGYHQQSPSAGHGSWNQALSPQGMGSPLHAQSPIGSGCCSPVSASSPLSHEPSPLPPLTAVNTMVPSPPSVQTRSPMMAAVHSPQGLYNAGSPPGAIVTTNMGPVIVPVSAVTTQAIGEHMIKQERILGDYRDMTDAVTPCCGASHLSHLLKPSNHHHHFGLPSMSSGFSSLTLNSYPHQLRQPELLDGK